MAGLGCVQGVEGRCAATSWLRMLPSELYTSFYKEIHCREQVITFADEDPTRTSGKK
jgi:hypothetical protein